MNNIFKIWKIFRDFLGNWMILEMMMILIKGSVLILASGREIGEEDIVWGKLDIVNRPFNVDLRTRALKDSTGCFLMTSREFFPPERDIEAHKPEQIEKIIN